MKKLILVLFVIGLIANVSYGQNTKKEERIERKVKEKELFLTKKNTIRVSPLNVLFRQFQFSYERKFGANNSLMLIGSVLHNRDAVYNSFDGINFALATELHYRKYVYSAYLMKKKNPVSQNSFGVYAAPFAGYQYLEKENTGFFYNDDTDFGEYYYGRSIQNAIQLGLVTGINFNLLKGRLSLDFYAGFAEKVSFVKGDAGLVTNDYFYNNDPGVLQFDVFGIIPKANMQIGFNF